MGRTTSTPTSIRRISRWTIATAAVAGLLVAASGAPASPGDYRSPDARAGAVLPVEAPPQDFRSPDARNSVPPAARPAGVDLRSPDARQSGQFTTSSAPQQPAEQSSASSSGFDWAYLAIAVGVLSLAIGAGFLLVQRRRHRVMPIGS